MTDPSCYGIQLVLNIVVMFQRMWLPRKQPQDKIPKYCFVEWICVAFYSVSLSVIHSHSRRISSFRVGQPSLGRVQHLGPSCKDQNGMFSEFKENMGAIWRKLEWMTENYKQENDIQLCIIKTPINIHHRVQKTLKPQRGPGPKLRPEVRT